MEKGLLFFTLAAGAFWLILDEFYGTKKVSGIASQLTPQLNNPITNAIDTTVGKVKEFTQWNVATPEEKEKTHKKIIEDIDKNENIKTKEAKKAIKDVVDDFYLKGGGMVTS